MKIKSLIIIAVSTIVIFGCKKEELKEVIDFNPIEKTEFSGFAQKGPYLNGSSVAIYEYDSLFNQTGKSYITTIIDNIGNFEQKDISLVTQFALLKADGYYFNEITGENSLSQLTLYSISDLSDKSTANVNVLTHLEKSRVEYLIQKKGLGFNTAKNQAQKEILRIFNIEKSDIQDSETLSLTNSGDDDAILLAISMILQGYRSTAELSDLLANIITDIKEDGVLNSALIGSKLISDAKLLKQAELRSNLNNRYEELGLTIELPNFEKYINNFISKSSFEDIKTIEYPETSLYGTNILNNSITSVTAWEYYSLSANLPAGTSLKIKISGGMWVYRVMPNGPINWYIDTYNFNTKTQNFTVLETEKQSDVSISFENGPITIEYFVNGELSPSKTKILVVE